MAVHRWLASLVLLSLAGIGGSADAQDGFPIGKAFTAVSLGDASFAAPAPTLMVEERDGKTWASGFGGCNKWGGPVEIGSGGRFQVDRIQVTRMACKQGAAMRVEAQFLAALRQATQWRQDGETLVLRGPLTMLRLEPGG